MKTVALFGATGSIGGSALDVIARHPDRFRVGVLSANRNVEALADLCARHQPDVAIIADPALRDALATALRSRGLTTQAAAGENALEQAARDSHNDIVIAAIVGAAGLRSTLAAARAGKRLLLANKESAVMAGPLLRAALRDGGGELIPIDSEHNALFQCLPQQYGTGAMHGVCKLWLTASGGPFRGRTHDDLRHVTPEQACAHPKWRMGRKISVDSATLMNKGLEVIEAHVLFDLDADAIEVVVHPQSVAHSLVEYVDGSFLAQLGQPDMRTAIAHALAWPERIEAGVSPLDPRTLSLQFEPPDVETFRCLALARQALRAGGDAPMLLNAANEVAVAAFLEGTLPFLGIPDVIEAILAELPPQTVVDVESLLERDLTARRAAQRMIRERATG
ncbi:MAG TPA: 1-deoxy-D-xylulose-5-phosphate reductoisomerase [Rhodanobacteraceae bacterium]|nr:1-deoxy-D-xylulose-5-phosphate reductoisomerase [Rhodanobacteraceae bacterium]